MDIYKLNLPNSIEGVDENELPFILVDSRIIIDHRYNQESTYYAECGKIFNYSCDDAVLHNYNEYELCNLLRLIEILNNDTTIDIDLFDVIYKEGSLEGIASGIDFSIMTIVNRDGTVIKTGIKSVPNICCIFSYKDFRTEEELVRELNWLQSIYNIG